MIREDALRYMDILINTFPALIKSADTVVQGGIDDAEEYVHTSNDFLLALVSLSMLLHEDWLANLENVLGNWEGDDDR